MNKLTLSVETLRVLGEAHLEDVQGGRGHGRKYSQNYAQCGTGAMTLVIPCPVDTAYAQCGTGAQSLVVAC